MAFAANAVGDSQPALQIPGDFSGFSVAGFDGADVFRFDGSGNLIDVALTTDRSLSCLWYVIPGDAVGETPAVSAGAPAKPDPAASRSPGTVTGLPSTHSGASSHGDTTLGSSALVAMGLFALACAVFVTRRRVAIR